MTAAASELQSHPNISAIYDDMVNETASPVPQQSHAHVQTFTVCTKTFDGADDSPRSQEGEGTQTFITIDTKMFDGSAADLPKKKEKRSFSRKNSMDSIGATSSVRPVNRNFSRKSSTDSAFSIYNDDDAWCQRIGEIMNREVAPSSTSQEQHQPPVDNIDVSSSSDPTPTSSSSRPKIRRSQSTDCPFTMLATQQGSESAWLKKQQFGGNLSRRNSIDTGKKKHSRSTSPKFIPPLDSFGADGTTTAPSRPRGGFSRRNSMTRSLTVPKFVEPLDSSEHDESRVFRGRARRHTQAAPNESLSQQLEALRESRAYSFRGLQEPSTPEADTKNEQTAVPRKPLSRHNSVEGVDPSIFPTLPMLDKSVSSDDTDANLDLALLFERLVKEDEADDTASVSSDEEDDEERVVIQMPDKSKRRRRCSTGGLRSFEREDLRNFIEDTEGDTPLRRSVPEPVRKGSLYRKCSTGGLRTLQRENSRDLYSDDCSLDDGDNKGRVLATDTAFDNFLKKLTREADVDTSNDAKIIDQHVGPIRRRSSIVSVSSVAEESQPVGKAGRRRSSNFSVTSIAEEVEEGAEDPSDFAAFISRVGQGMPKSSSQTVSTVANTSCSSDSYGNSRQPETVRTYSKKTLPHSIQVLPLDESVSSIETSPPEGGEGTFSCKNKSQVNFRSSKSRSIRRLASSDGLGELQTLAECMEPPSTRRSSCVGFRTPDEEEIAVKDLPRLIKKIDRDLASEKAAYRKRSSGSGPVSEKERNPSAVKQRRPLEPPGTPAPATSGKDDAPKHRTPQQTKCNLFVSKEEVPLVTGMAKYKPRRSSTKTISDDKEDRERFGEQGKSNGRKRKEQAKNKTMRRKSSSGAFF